MSYNGTGIGGALIINGKILHGFSGSACEVGYMHLPSGEFQELGADSVLVRKVEQCKGFKPGSIDGKYVLTQAWAGDEAYIRAVDEMTEVLGMGIANICYVVNPEVVVLGGGIMSQKDYLENRLRVSLQKYLIPSVEQNTRIEFAKFQNKAGMLGAYLHFLQRQEAQR